MAVFSAIASAIVGSIFTAGTILGSTLLYAAAVGVVAAGLGFATAKLLGVFDPPDLGPDPGVKIQVAPSTDNKIGVAFGRNFMSGPITDVAITNSNDTMNYCITLSEYLEGATYTVNNIYWGDSRLNFSGANVISQYDPNATTNTNWANKIRMRLYAGSTNSADQVFPTSGAVNATTMMRHWTNPTAYSMEDLVFLMVEVDYDAENGLTGLGALSVDMTVNIDNPGEVLQRYLNNSTWGAGLANTFIDTTSVIGTANTAMKGYCDEQISFTNNAGAGATIDRWQTNGYINTNRAVLENIDRICRNANTFFTFDGKQGKFKAVPNRALSSTELASCFVLNDDNIVSKIGVQSTELYSLFNSVKVEFADRNRKDQTNTVVVTTPAGDRNTGEQDNELNFRSELVNNNVHATALANIDLVQSRNGMVIQLDGDYSTLQIDAGDVVKLTNSVYGFTDRLFRVMLNKEKLTQDGMITCELTLLEYNADIYTVPAVTETPEEDDPLDIPISPPADDTPPPNKYQLLYQNVPSKSVTGTGTTCNSLVFKQGPNVYSNVLVTSGTADFTVGDTVIVSGGNLGGIDGTHDLSFTVDTVSSGSIVNPVGNITGVANVYDRDVYGGTIPTSGLADLTAGAQIEDAPANKTDLPNDDTVVDLFTPRNLDYTLSIEGIEPGDYSFVAQGTPIGAMPGSGTANFSFRANVVTTDVQGVSSSTEFGATVNNDTTIPKTMTAVKKITIPADSKSGSVVLRGKNTLDTNSAGQRGFANMKYDLIRINKGDIF